MACVEACRLPRRLLLALSERHLWKLTGSRTSVPPPEIKAHSTRAVSASSGSRGFRRRLCKATTWSSIHTFRRTTADSSLGRRILQAAVWQQHTPMVPVSPNEGSEKQMLRTKARTCASIILRGANDFMCDEMERSVHDALCVVKRVLESKSVVPGGGAVEAALSIYLENYATSMGTTCNCRVCKSTSGYSKTLAVNAAQDSTDLVAKLRAFHNEAQVNPERKNLKWLHPYRSYEVNSPVYLPDIQPCSPGYNPRCNRRHLACWGRFAEQPPLHQPQKKRMMEGRQDDQGQVCPQDFPFPRCQGGIVFPLSQGHRSPHSLSAPGPQNEGILHNLEECEVLSSGLLVAAAYTHGLCPPPMNSSEKRILRTPHGKTNDVIQKYNSSRKK
ncbi:unnamed protein product [Ranitomeya imitator]|uniref:Uncharacterized protein n=1 Tax=Ranitomeya imitator TaxID=111125 RepID=A0ABN9MPE1_9NEOB|nr:unnamed protein product [Ranitomeya imitator]